MTVIVPSNLRDTHARIRHELGSKLAELGYGRDLESNPVIAEAFDAVLPPCCETCGVRFSAARLMDWRGPWENAPWWSAPRLCEPCLVDEELSEREKASVLAALSAPTDDPLSDWGGDDPA